MSEHAKVRGHLRVPVDIDLAPAIKAISVGYDFKPQYTHVRELLTDHSGFMFRTKNLVVSATHWEADVKSSGWFDTETDAIRELARAGATGWLDIKEYGTTRLVLHDGDLIGLSPKTYHPNDPRPEALVVAFTRAEATAMLQVATGESPADIDAIVHKLIAVL